MPQRQKKSYGRKKKYGRTMVGKKKLSLQSHNFVERVEDEIVLNNSTLDANGHLSICYVKSFAMDDIAQIASYKELFDDY